MFSKVESLNENAVLVAESSEIGSLLISEEHLQMKTVREKETNPTIEDPYEIAGSCEDISLNRPWPSET